MPANKNDHIEQLVAQSESLQDGEILGLDADGSIVQWSDEDQAPYNCGDTPEQFGLSNISPVEMARIRAAQ